jgi:hypothetical protein
VNASRGPSGRAIGAKTEANRLYVRERIKRWLVLELRRLIAIVRKGVSREVSNAIYRIIDGGFRKSFTGLFYSLTHRIL